MPEPRTVEGWADQCSHPIYMDGVPSKWTIDRTLRRGLCLDCARAYADQCVSDALEQAANETCEYCKKGVSLDPGNPKKAHAVYHRTGVVYARCKAAAIRALKPKEHAP